MAFQHIAVKPALKLGILWISRRPSGVDPIVFRRSAKSRLNDKLVFHANDIFLRDNHESRPAEPDDLPFLFSEKRRRISDPRHPIIDHLIEHNIPGRDPDFIKFVGRRDKLDTLWFWLTEHITPVKLIAGMGGIGKTTLAIEFLSQIVESKTEMFEKILWISAKPRQFVASTGKTQERHRRDFHDSRSLLLTLAESLGY